MNQDYLLDQKCPACGSRQQNTLKAIKTQRVFECKCCSLVIALQRAPEACQQSPGPDKNRKEEILAV